MAKVIDRDGWAVNERWQGEVQGTVLGTDFCLIFNDFDEIGRGPRLHTHPYAETFVVRAGKALFTVGEQQIEAVAGQILVVPANTAHKFENLGPGRLETIDIHENATFVTEWLE
jgi:mannose-6-phosphate isomerase-like protein (cupin superfamily)